MAKLVLVVGGCRSGKSAYAQQLALALPPSRAYVATCPVTDEEMRQRIAAHRQARCGQGWETIEEPLDLAGVFRRNAERNGRQHNVLLVDCLTLWVNNLMYRAAQEGGEVDESQVAQHCAVMLDAAQAGRGTTIFVSNEVGMGIVPDNAQARRYRDLVGRVNQLTAARAEKVALVSCGIALPLKESA